MPISQSLLPEFDHEMANTRKTLERIPDSKFAWKPHEKSMTLQKLATHLAELPGWAGVTLTQDFFDYAPVGGQPYQSPVLNSAQEIVAYFDKNVAGARAALVDVSDENLMKPWSLQAGGKPLFTMPRIAVLRSFVMNHIIHHRAQLGVYLRLNDVAVPGIYGPSADEGTM